MVSTRWLRPAIAGLVLSALVALAGGAPPLAHAANFAVNSTIDATDANPGDGVCASAAGDCTLRAAVQEANALPGADAITLPAGTYTLTIAPSGVNGVESGDLNITDDLTISGGGLRQLPSTIVDGNATDRAFDIDDPVSVSMTLFTIQNGAAHDGGAIKLTQGTLTLTQMRLHDSVASGTGNPDGGAIAAFGESVVTIEDSVLSGNAAESSGGAIWNEGTLSLTDTIVTTNSAGLDGGGLRNGGQATLLNSSIVSNTADGGAVGGGGVYNTSDATLDLTESSISLNSAVAADGGGLRNSGEAHLRDSSVFLNTTPAGNGAGIHNVGLLTVDGSTVSGNVASGDGGGLLVASGGDATASLTNSTISGNEAGDDGGGIQTASGATVTLVHVTLALNVAADNGGGVNVVTNTTVSAQATILDANSGANCSGAPMSNDHNLDSDGSCGFAGASDQNNVDPLLEPLALNGGPTQTHALPAASPAVNAANPANHPPRDQRGVLRPAATPDIGAFERSFVDLEITIQEVPPGLIDLGAFALELQVGNEGPDDAQRVELRAEVPEGVALDDAAAGCSVGQGVLRCALDDLPAGAESTPVVLNLILLEPGSFDFRFRLSSANSEAAPDNNGLDIQLSAAVVERAVILLPGWNLVPWFGAETAASEAFAGIGEALSAAFTWNAPAQRFRSFNPQLPASVNSLDRLSTGVAIWILIGGDAQIRWTQPDGKLPTEWSLAAGFNLVVWGGADGVAIAEGLGSVEAGSVAAWDAPGQRFVSFRPQAPAQLNELEAFLHGLPFWIEVSVPVTWSQPSP